MVCTQITIQGPGTSCQALANDTWKPETTNPASGESLDYTVHSADPNKYYELYYETPGQSHVVASGTTDQNGCDSGTITALPDGEYKIWLCYPTAGVCLWGHSEVIVRWGAKPLDLTTAALIGAGILGLAYILGNRGKK